MNAMDTAEVETLERRLERAARQARSRSAERERDELICELAQQDGVTLDRIGEVAGLTKGRVSQIVTRARARQKAEAMRRKENL